MIFESQHFFFCSYCSTIKDTIAWSIKMVRWLSDTKWGLITSQFFFAPISTAVESCWVTAVLRPWPTVLWFACFHLTHSVSPSVLGFCHPGRLLGQRLPGSTFLHHWKGQGADHILVSYPSLQYQQNHRAGKHSTGCSSEHRCVCLQCREPILTQIDKFPIRLFYFFKSEVSESLPLPEVMA